MLDLPKWAEAWVTQGCPKCGTRYYRHNVSRVGVLQSHPFRGPQHFFFDAFCMRCNVTNTHRSEAPFTVRDFVECFAAQYREQAERKKRRKLLARRRRARLRKPIGDAEVTRAKKTLQGLRNHDELLKKLKIKPQLPPPNETTGERGPSNVDR